MELDLGKWYLRNLSDHDMHHKTNPIVVLELLPYGRRPRAMIVDAIPGCGVSSRNRRFIGVGAYVVGQLK